MLHKNESQIADISYSSFSEGNLICILYFVSEDLVGSQIKKVSPMD